jgi:GDP-L-fucose synthase
MKYRNVSTDNRADLPVSAPTSGFWTNKRVIVTGGAGFLGRWVVHKLHERQAAEVIVPRKAEHDLRQQQDIVRLLREVHGGPAGDALNTIVIHLAAHVGGIGANRARPAEFFYDNLMMGVQLLHECWQASVSKFVAIGTVCAYPKHTPVPFRESDLWNGYPEETNAPYGLAKKMLLVQSDAYRTQYGFNSIFLLPVNLYGPGDNFDLDTSHVIPALIRKCSEAKARGQSYVQLWGDGSPTREFLYVDDAAEAILLATELYDDSEPVNIGSGNEIQIRMLAEMIAQTLDYQGELRWDVSQPNGQPRRRLDTERAKRLFGFSATTPLETGLRLTIQWYQDARCEEPVSQLVS